MSERHEVNGEETDARLSRSERRYLTVGFCDLVGSSTLSEDLDPEAMRAIFDKFQTICIGVVSKYGGKAVSSAGDGILFQFGFPKATEADAERAVRASLEIRDQVAATDFSSDYVKVPTVRAKVGLSSGLVLVSPEKTATWHISHNLVGDAVNVASRVQALAPSGGVLVSGETLDMVNGVFTTEGLGPHQLKGLSRPVELFEVRGLTLAADRSRLRFSRNPREIVGRTSELDRLNRVWLSNSGAPRAVFLQGEAGVGKTRLIEEFRQRFCPPDVHFIKLSCFEISASIPFNPIIAFLRGLALLVPEDTLGAAAAKIDALFQRLAVQDEIERHVIKSLLGVDTYDPVKTGSTLPGHRKKLEFQALLRLFECLIGATRSIIFFDDVHWGDPSSLEFMELILSRVRTPDLMLLLASREPAATAECQLYSDVIELGGLTEGESQRVLKLMLGSDRLDEQVTKRIVDLADGIPFYLEELALAAVERQNVAALGQGSAKRQEVVPLPLANLLSERLDRVPSMQPLLRVLSTFAGPTSIQTLGAVLELPHEELRTDLHALEREGILMFLSSGEQEWFDFRHALLARICYGGMVQAVRRECHGRIVKALKSGQLTALPIELVAHHTEGAGFVEEAAQAWLKAGTESARRSANLEAIDSLQRALSAIERLDANTGRANLETLATVSLVGPYVAVKGFCAPEVLECCTKGIALCTANPSQYIFPFLYARFTWEITSGRVVAALATAQHFLALSKAHQYSAGETIGNRIVGMALFANGKALEAKAALNASIENYDWAVDEAVTYLFGANSKVTGQALLCLVLYFLGDSKQAISLGQSTLREADELRHPLSTGIALSYIGGFLAAYRGKTEEVAQEAARLVEFSMANNLRVFLHFGEFFLGWSSFQLGNPTEGIESMTSALESMNSLGWRLSVPSMMALLAECQVEDGRLDEATQLCAKAKEFAYAGGELWGESEILRVEALAGHRQAEEISDTAVLIMRSADGARDRLSATFEKRSLTTALEVFAGDSFQAERIIERIEKLRI